MKLYLIRHGETDWNVARRLQGGTDIPLNQKGLDLAYITADGLKDIPFDVIFTSPLQRAKQTTLAIAEGRNIEIIDEPRVREISFGPYEGIPCVNKVAGEVPDELLNFFTSPHLYVAPNGGETLESLCDRTAEFLEWLISKEEYQDSTILISTHGAAMMGLLNGVRRINRKLQGDFLPDDLSIFWGEGVPRNCAVTILECDESGIYILEENKIFYDASLSGNFYDVKNQQ